MKSHNGMRPQDIAILLKLAIHDDRDWNYRDLAAELDLSLSEVSESLIRSQIAGLVDTTKRKVHRMNLIDFVQHGIKFVFPQLPGTLVTGMPTGHSHPAFKKKFVSEGPGYVWADDQGDTRGLAIAPLYKGAAKAARRDKELYLMMAAIDMIRIGRAREVKEGVQVISEKLLIG